MHEQKQKCIQIERPCHCTSHFSVIVLQQNPFPSCSLGGMVKIESQGSGEFIKVRVK